MPYINLNKIEPENCSLTPAVHDGVHFAHAAVRFTALGLIAMEKGWSLPKYHLYALAIELAFKSLALRSGATLADCRRTSHRPSAMIDLIERLGTKVPARLKTRLADDRWFKTFLLLTRYPAVSEQNTSLDTTIFLHHNYPEMIAEILETPCKWPLQFERGSALAEIQAPPGPRIKVAMFTEGPKTKKGRTNESK